MRENPVYKRERTVSSRSARLPAILMLFNGILAVVALLNMYSMASQVEVTAEIEYSRFLDLYVFVASIEFLLLCFIMPALTAGSISGERERGTLELMLSTQMTSREIVLGKLVSSLYSMALLVISSFPVIALVFVYGGIQMKDVGSLLLLYMVVALLSASIGLCFSAICKRSTMATAPSYGFLAFLIAGTYGINFFVWSMSRIGATGYLDQVGGITAQGSSGMFLYLLLLDPVLTFYQIIEAQAGNLGMSAQVIQGFGSRASGPVMEAWIPLSLLLQIFLASCFLLVAIRAVDPVRGEGRGLRKRKKT